MNNLWLTFVLVMGAAVSASYLSQKLFIVTVLFEILLGVIYASFGFQSNDIIIILASFGAILMTYLSGLECDWETFRRNLFIIILLGSLSFLLPFITFFSLFYYMLNWSFEASLLCAAALSETSIAMVYSVVVGRGYNSAEYGKFIFGVMFVTDILVLLTVTLFFADFDKENVGSFLAISTFFITLFFAAKRTYLQSKDFSQAGERFILLILCGLALASSFLKSLPVLPIFIFGILTSSLMKNNIVSKRIKQIALSLFVPFYFLRAGLLIDLKSILNNFTIVGAIFIIKIICKVISSWPILRKTQFTTRESAFIVLMLTTGLTFGTFIAIFGLDNNIISETQYSIIIVSVIITAIIPSTFAQIICKPKTTEEAFS